MPYDLNWPLMSNNITRDDLDILIEYLRQDDPRLTQGNQVRAFEEPHLDERACEADAEDRRQGRRRAAAAGRHRRPRGHDRGQEGEAGGMSGFFDFELGWCNCGHD